MKPKAGNAFVNCALQIAQMAALVTRRPDEEHPRYHSLRALSDEQYQEALEREGKEINNESDWNAFLASVADRGRPDNPEIGDAWVERS